ncbi:MAG: Zinc finger homeobox protein 3, partial [Marteilia pararefringens]
MTQRSDPAQSNEMSDQKDQISKKFDNNEPALDQSDGLRTERAYISRSTTKSAMSEDDQLKVSSSSSIRDVEVIRDKLTEENDNNDCRLQVKSLKVEGISTSVVADTADRELQMKHSIMTKKDQTMNHNKNNKGNTCNSEMISKYVDSKRTIVPEEAIYKNKSYNNASRGGFRMHANCVIETNANSCSETRIGPPRPSVAAEPTIANDSRLKACHFPSMRPDATNTSSSIKSFTPRFISTPGFVSKTDGRTIMVPNSGISLTSDISSNSYPQEDSIDTNIRFAQYRLRKLHNAGQNDSRYSDRVMELKGRAKSKPEAEVGFPRLTIDKADLSAIPSSYSCAEFKFPIQTNNAGRFFCHLCNHGISNVIDFKRHLTEVHKVDPMIAENFIPTNLSRLCRENLRYFPHSYNQQLNSRFESQSVMKNKRKILEASHRRNAIRGDSVGKAGENEETFSLNDACYSTEPHDKFVSNKDARRTRDMRIRITSPCHRSFMRTSPWSETKNGFRLNLIDKNYHKTSRNSTSTSIKPNDSSPESSNGASQGNYTISDNKMQNTIQDAKLDSQRNNLLGPHSRLQQTASSNDRNNCSAGFASTLNSHKNELRHLNELDRRVLEDYYAFRPIPLAKDIIILSCELRLSKDLISLWFAERHKLTNRENHRRGSFISGSYRPFFEQPKYFRHPLRHHNCPICYAIFPTYIHLVRHMHSCRESQYLSHDCGTRSVKDHYIIAGWHGRHFLRHNEDQKPADPIRFSNSDRLLSNHKYVPNAKSTIESGKYCEAEPAKENLTNYHCFADNIRSENGKNGTSRAVSHSLTEKSMDGKWEDNEADRIEELIAREDSSDKIQDDDQNSSKTEPKEPHIGEDCDSQVKSRSFDREMRNGDHQQFVSEIDGKSEEESWAKYAADSNLDDGDFSTQTQISTFEQNHDFSSEDCENKNIPNKRKMTRSSRTRFSDLQIKVLYDYFRFRQYPTDSEIGFLSRELRLDRRVITVWFQNSRQKLKAQIRKFNKSGGEATNASRAVKSISARMMNGKTSHLSDIIYSERTAMDVSTSPNSDQLYFKNTTHSCFYCHAVYPTYIHLVHHIRFCKYCPTAQGFSHSSYSEKSA